MREVEERGKRGEDREGQEERKGGKRLAQRIVEKEGKCMKLSELEASDRKLGLNMDFTLDCLKI